MRGGLLAAWLLALGAFGSAHAAEPVRCAKTDVARSRRSAEKLYREGRYSEAVESLRRTKDACWSTLDATDRGWLASDLGLAALRAGQPELCRQVLAEAPPELDPQSKVAKALAHNRKLCQGEGSVPVQVFESAFRLFQLTSAADAPEALKREWPDSFPLRDGRLPQREDREANRCTELEGVTLRDLEVRTTVELEPAQARLLLCGILKKLAGARPSRVSHVRDVLASKDLGSVLPAELSPNVPGSAPTRGRAWSEAEPGLVFEVSQERKGEVRVEGEYDEGLLEWLALGDFNGDGLEDAAVFRTLGGKGGSESNMAVFLLTRTQPGGLLRILERME
jgi:hypothetical protein